MSTYYDLVKNYLGVDACENHSRYCEIGYTFYVNNEDAEGYYWFYETEHFIVEIHDFLIKEETVRSASVDMNQFMSFCSCYIMTGNGECFNPYQNLSSSSLYVIDIENLSKDYKFILHGNFPYLSVGFCFKKEIIEEYLHSVKNSRHISYADIFLNKNATIIRSLEPLAKDILNCKMKSPAAELFFEAKAKEWLSLTIDSFLNKNNVPFSKNDDKILENVAKYLDDHYAINVSQKTLEKISMMSGTKLKKLFKQKYQLSIVEYSQRKRMNMAEVLLLNSSLSIKDIAESVGYSSHSKFSTYFKKYKGVYPREIRKLSKSISHI